jgi:hypothetical protein
VSGSAWEVDDRSTIPCVVVDGALARRPRSTAWWRLGWSEVTHRWSDDEWDWALAVWDEDQASRLDASAIAGLVRALGT